MGCAPVPVKATLHDACPDTIGCAAHPVIGAPASMNAAVPVGVTCTGPTGETVASKIPG
jgi:hypothetical protein